MLDRFSVSNWAKKKKKQESSSNNYNDSNIGLNGTTIPAKKGLSNEICNDLKSVGTHLHITF